MQLTAVSFARNVRDGYNTSTAATRVLASGR